ncbi:MAG TPA: LicD family protein [Candidatus Pullichristensenella avicola]|nr:LicD family protein [Candidatus Pullichristensenella avicola]
MDTNAAKEMTLAEVQAREFELLKVFDAYCRRHGLTYCLCGGTLLGAVRHKGFIPWDDDIDLMMPRDDYDRLRALAAREPVCDFLTVRYPGDAAYPYGFAKVVDDKTVVYERNITQDAQRAGLALDIFPLDRMYASAWKNRLLLARIKFWIQVGKVGAGMVRPERDSLKKRLRNLVMLLLRPVAACTRYEKVMAKVDRIAAGRRETTPYILGNLGWPNQWKDMFPKEVFASYVDLDFETGKFPCPVGYDAYLTQLYGNYMRIPKEGERAAHSFRAYWRDEA